MGFYARKILPWVIDTTCSNKAVHYQRRKVVPLAEGQVLEIGVGSGLNFPFYDEAKVERVFALEPSAEMLEKAKPRIEAVSFPVEPLGLDGEHQVLADRQVGDDPFVTPVLARVGDLM